MFEQSQGSYTLQKYDLKGNEVLWLNDPQTIWLIHSGAVALFSIPYQNGAPEGKRHHLFNAIPGQVLFGTANDPDDALTIIAVALEPTELERLTLPQQNLPDLAEVWIQQLGQIKGLPRRPLSFVPPQVQLPQMQYLSLLKGQIYQPQADQIVWVQVQAGRAFWKGDPDLTLTKDSGVFPFSHHLWLEADDPLSLFLQKTPEIDQSDLLNGLQKLQIYLLRHVQSITEQDAQISLERFQERQRLNQQVTQQTIDQLVSVLNPQQADLDQSQTPLLIAAGAIAKTMGVTIVPPAKSEDLSRVQEPLEAIARASHLRLRRVLLRDRWWRKDGSPMLAYTRMDRHPVALLPTEGRGYQMFNPIQAGLVNFDVPSNTATALFKRMRRRIFVENRAEGGSQQKFWFYLSAKRDQTGKNYPIVDEALASSLDPIAYVFYTPLPEGGLNAIDLLRFALTGRQQDLLTIFWTGIAFTLLGMLIPQATAVLINMAIPSTNLSLLVQIGLGLLAAALGGACFQLAQAIASMRIETLSDASLQAAVWDRLLKLKPPFFRQYATGDLNSRVSGISTIRRKLSGTTLQTLFAGTFSLLNLALLFAYDSTLATLASGIACLIIIVTVLTSTLLVRQQQRLLELEGSLFGIVVQLINGVPKLRIAGAEERAFAHWGQRYAQQLRLKLKTQFLEDGVDLFNTLVPPLSAIALFWFASGLMNPETDGLSVGTFLAFNVAFGIFIAGVSRLSMTVTEILDVVPLWQRSQPILAAEPEMAIGKVDPGRLSGRIRVDRVAFRYREEGALILDNVSIQTQPGEFIALVGPSGSGKSTILRLLLGFETPISGAVYYDGQDLAGLDVTAVRRQFGVVLQNGRINAGSIFENIASGALITLEEAWAAAENSGLAEDIRAMPMQLHTVISEGGSNLSGGQRQRLLIARALALRPRILLFDEATSALDNRTQAIVSESLDRLQVTRVVIAHRLSTIRNADRIYVLEAGRVVQQGSFAELAKQPGLFAQLIQRQIV